MVITFGYYDVFQYFCQNIFLEDKTAAKNRFCWKNALITGFEFKWKVKGKTKLPEIFIKKYNSEIKIIDKDNFRDFVIV